MKKAFTLIEVLVAVVILAAVIGAAAAVEVKNTRSSSTNKRQIEALGLAQEGLSGTKAVKDTDKLNNASNFPNAEGSYKINSSGGLDKVNSVPASGVCKDLGIEGVEIDLGGHKYCREIIIKPAP